MRPSHACIACRERRRKCEVTNQDEGCTLCLSHGWQCSLAKYPPVSGTAAPTWDQPNDIPNSPSYEGIVRHHRDSIADMPPPAICEELVDLYIFHIHDKFHSLFHPPSLLEHGARGTLPNVILLPIMSLSARFSTNSYFDGVEPRLRGGGWAREAARLLDLRELSLASVQACVLLGCCHTTEGEAAVEAVYYSVACRMAMLLDLPGAPDGTRLEREVRIRVWWSLCMIDVWSSAGVRLPRSIPSPGNAPMPMDEATFLNLRPGDQIDLHMGYNSEYSLLTQMIKLNSILVEINAINEQATSEPIYDFHDYEKIEDVSLKLDAWVQGIPAEMQDTDDNLAYYATRGLGNMFVAVYLGFYNFGQMLYYQFLHSDCDDDDDDAAAAANNGHQITPTIRAYANRCKAHATALCRMIYRSHETPGCEVTYTMVGHILVIASSIQLHTLLFDTDEVQIRSARRMLERNFQILTRLRTFWPTLDLCFARLREFHNACLRSQEGRSPFTMDRWMLRFLLEFAKPIGEKKEVATPPADDHRHPPLEFFDPGPLTMQSLGFYSPS